MSRLLLLGAVSGALLAAPASAATFENVSGSGQRSAGILSTGPLGQSFQSIDSVLNSIGFQFNALNPGTASTAVTFTLREGEGLTGTVLFTGTFTLPTAINSRTPAWYDFAIGNVAVSAGSLYTAVVSSSSNRLGLIYGPDINLDTGQPIPGGRDTYLPGQFLSTTPIGGAICAGDASICDTNFRVTGTTAAAVPEPATWAMMIGGFGLVGGAMRRRRSTVVFA